MKTCKLITLISLVLALVLTLCACPAPDPAQDDTINLAVVGANRANMNALAVNHTEVQDALYNACYRWGNVSFVLCDGSPRVVYGCTVKKPDKTISATKHKQLAENYASQLQAILSSQMTAQSEEADTLEAIRIAGYQLNNAAGDRVLIVLDNGLSTCSYLDFAGSPTLLLDSDPQVVLNALEQAQAIPDLAGVSVYWLGIGETAQPQPALSQAQKENLKAIWQAILEAGGAQVSFKDGVTTYVPNDPTALPHVSVVTAQDRHLLPTTTLTQEQVAFQGNSSVFADPDAARAAIAGLAQAMKDLDNKVIVLGCTAGGDNGTTSLARDRAQAVADELISMGISPGRLHVVGLAAEANPFYSPDLDENGRQIESIASKNRFVMIIDQNSDDAALLP